MTRHLLSVTFLVALFLVGGAQCLCSQPATRIGWHYAAAASSAETEEAAVRQAKARGIAAVMETLAKDELFTRMLLSEYPLAVSVDSLVVDGDTDHGFSARLRVGVDGNAVNLTEGPYEGAAVGLLERSERLLQQADAATRRGADRESQLSAQDAYGAYSEAQSVLEEVRVILAPLGDNSVFTRSGSNLAALRTRLDALETSVAGGLARIERIEQDLEAEQGVRQSVETLRALEERVDAARTVVERYVVRSPFFDIPREELESIRGELEATSAELAAVADRLIQLRSTVEERDPLVAERAQIEITAARTLMDRSDRMVEEVVREIRYPRLERQADEARRKLRRQAVAEGIRWSLLHQPGGHIRAAKTAAVVIDHRDGLTASRPTGFSVSGEVAFVPGVWLMTRLDRRVTVLAGGGNQRELTQRVAAGAVGRRLFGVGYGWDWHAVREQADPVELAPTRAVSLYLGRPNDSEQRIDLLVAATYRVPHFWGAFIGPYHLNLETVVTARLPRFLTIEGATGSWVDPIAATLVETAPSPTVNEQVAAAIGSSAHHIWFRTGIGLRIPAPWTWKVRYGHDYTRPADGSAPLELLSRGWRFAVEYSL